MTAQSPTKKRPLFLIVIGIVAACCIGTLIFGSLLPKTTPSPTSTPVPTQTLVPTISPVESYLAEYGGNIEVYQRIFSSTDCKALQDEFDQADANLKLQEPGTPQYKWGIGYMKASDERMKSIGCY